MGIIYLLSVLLLIIMFILIKKTDKEINIVNFICISIVTLFCYNTFICYVLTFFTIPTKLWVLAVINLLIAGIFLFLILKKKMIQKYIFNKIDLIYICILALIVIIISYINFGFPFNVNYDSGGDSATHFFASLMFADSDYLLGAEQKSDYIFGTLGNFRPASYVNSGLLMKSIFKNIQSLQCYNIFAAFGIFDGQYPFLALLA